jgi:hypothetical protein
MKRSPPLLLSFALLATPAAAQVQFTYSVSIGNATITGYYGLPPFGDLIIPPILDDLTVAAIADYAFNDVTSITNVSIPSSVTNIGDGAFAGCAGLANFMVDARNLFYSVTNGVLFNKNLTTIVEFPGGLAGSYAIPGSVTDIGLGAFQKCENLTDIFIPGSVATIEDYAFENCTGLTNVMIPASVSSIGAGPFSGCASLAAISVDANNLFYSATNGALFDKSQATLIEYPGGIAGSYSVPGSVTTIEGTAFENCAKLAAVTIPNSVTNIGSGAFFGCAILTVVTVSDQNASFSSTNGILFDKDQSVLLDYPPGLSGSYTLPATVTGIAPEAFEDCDGLTGVKLPGSLTTVGADAFYDSLRLASVTIPGSVASIGSGAFENCSGLAGLTIDSGVANIESNAFENCYSLSSVSIPGSVTNIGPAAFKYCLSLPGIKIPAGVAVVGDEAFEFCSGMTSATIAVSVTNIGEEAFGYCSGLRSITIPGGVASVGPYTFYECAGLTHLTIPGNVTNIGIGAFEQCYDLASVIISSGVSSIGDYAFSDCTSLTQVMIPDSVTSIGAAPFSDCASLASIIVNTGNPEFSSANGVLFDKNQTALIEFPGGGAGSFAIPGSITRIGDYAFVNCPGLINVAIPPSVTNIGVGAFENCAGLGAITIPASVTSIADYAFDGTEVTNFYFAGNAPAIDLTVLDSDNSPAVYYLPGTTGWAEFSANAGVPATLWNAAIQITDGGFGIQSNQFGFNVTGSTNLVVVVETCSDLTASVWTPLETVTLTNGLFHFIESAGTNVSSRFFGLGFP